MNNPLETGRLGEQAAADFLEKKGWKIAARNYRAGKGEIDLIAWKNERVLVFVEVKTRGDNLFSAPQDAVDRKKREHVARTAGAFMQKIQHEGAVRFDIISVLLRDGELRDIQHIEDAFWLTG